MKIPDAAVVSLPKPSTAGLKILHHIIDVHNPHSTNNNALNGTTVIANEDRVNTGISVVTVLGDMMAPTIRIIPRRDTVVSIVLLDTLPPTILPMKRPISIRNQ